MSFPRYPKYKDSGIYWLGKVPEHWRVQRLKNAADICMGQSPPSEQCNLEGIGLPFLQGCAEFGTSHPTAEKHCVAPPKAAKEGDLLFSVRAPVGKLNVANMNYGIGRGLCAIRANRGNNPQYLFYWLSKTAYALDAVSTGSTYEAVSVNQVASSVALTPEAGEQLAIADFLGRETTKIDALIAEQKHLIELLEEKRQAVISHAVTKGLNPNAPMKYSGVEWLGEVPAHWELSRVKAISSFTTSGPRGWSEQISEDGALFVQSGDLNDYLGVDFEDCKRVRVSGDAEALRTRLQPGDAVVCITGAKTGNAAVCHELPEDSYINQHLCLIRPRNNIEPGFLGLLLKSHCGQTHFALAQYGLKQGLSLENVRETPLVLPPMKEQVEIVSYVNKVRGFMRSLINESHHSVEILKERRSALISAAVTGQIDVRGLVEAEGGEQ